MAFACSVIATSYWGPWTVHGKRNPGYFLFLLVFPNGWFNCSHSQLVPLCSPCPISSQACKTIPLEKGKNTNKRSYEKHRYVANSAAWLHHDCWHVTLVKKLSWCREFEWPSTVLYTQVLESISFFPSFSFCFYVNIYIKIYIYLFVAMFPQSITKQEGCTLEVGQDLLLYFRGNYLFLKRNHFCALHYRARLQCKRPDLSNCMKLINFWGHSQNSWAEN